MIRRREFITLLGSAAAAWPAVGRGQQAGVPVVGFLSARSLSDSTNSIAEFRKGLGEVGYVENRDITITYRWAEGQYDRLSTLAADLVRSQVAAIAAFSPPAAFAAKNATSTIPIVFTSGDDPVKDGLVTSLNRPGGNVTGISFFSGVLGAKRFDIIRSLVGKVEIVGVLLNPNLPAAQTQLFNAQEAARALGVKLYVLNVRKEDELLSAFTAIVQEKVDVLIISGDPYFGFERSRIANLAMQHKVPTIAPQRNFVEAGNLMSYGASLEDSYRLVGIYVARILKGEKPADLPVLQPTKFEFVINLKTAETLGIAVPDKLIALADEVIE